MTMKQLLITGFASVMLALAPAQAEEPLTVRFAHDYRAVSYLDENGDWRGTGVELVRLLLDEAGVDWKPVSMPWARAISLLKSGGIDMMINLTQRPDREPFFDFIGPNSYEQLALIVHERNRDVPIESIDDLVEMDAKIFDHGYYYPGISERRETDPRVEAMMIQPMTNYDAKVGDYPEWNMVEMGRVFGVFLDRVVYSDEFYQNGMREQHLVLHDFNLNSPQPVHIAMSRKADRALRDHIRATYRRLAESGRLAEVLRRHGIHTEEMISRMIDDIPAPISDADALALGE